MDAPPQDIAWHSQAFGVLQVWVWSALLCGALHSASVPADKRELSPTCAGLQDLAGKHAGCSITFEFQISNR